VAAIIAVAGGVFAFGDAHDWSNLATPAGSANGGLAGFGAAMFAALWAYSGWQYLPMAASEVQDPQRNLPRAIIGGSLVVLAIYLAVNTAYLYALPFWQVASANSTAYPEAPSVAARAVQTFLGTRAAPVAALIFLISTVGSLNGTILARARVSYASARDGLFFAGFGRLSPRTRVPVTSLVLLCIWAALLAVSGTFDQLTNMAVMSYALFWIPVMLAVLVLRRRLPHANAALSPAGLSVRAAGVRAGHGVDRDQRAAHDSEGIHRDAVVDPARTAAVPAVPQAPRDTRRCRHSDSSSQSVSGAPRRSQNPRPASRNWRRSCERYQWALRR